MQNAVIFDLDGTLADSASDIAKAQNSVLRKHGYPEHSVERFSKEFIGWGVAPLIKKSCPEGTSEEELAEITKEYKAAYLAACQAGGTIYPGIVKMLKTLKDAGLKNTVLTNKPQNMTDALKESSFGGNLDTCWGPRDDIPYKKPQKEFTEAFIREIQCNVIAYVGDSEVDIETAHNAGLYCIGVSWGNRNHQFMVDKGADLVVDTAEELTEAILKLNK